jgi:hypothetical protein
VARNHDEQGCQYVATRNEKHMEQGAL